MTNVIFIFLRNDKAYENTGIKEKQTEEYEEVGNKCGELDFYTNIRNI